MSWRDVAPFSAAMVGLASDDPRIAAVIEPAAVVFAIWREPSNASGFGALPVKGVEHMTGEANECDDEYPVVGVYTLKHARETENRKVESKMDAVTSKLIQL